LKLPKALVLGIVGGSAGLVLLLAIFILVRREPHRTDDNPIAKLLSVSQTASREEIRAAAMKGPAALEELATRFPKDPVVARELAFAYDAAGRNSDALRVVRLMAEEDPKGVPADLIRIAIRAASKVETSDEAFRLLEGPLGGGGVDALIELAESKDVPPSTALRAQRSLAKATVRASASPSSAFLLDLRNASTCEERHDVLVSSGPQADARASEALHALESKHGCGRRKAHDCNACLRKDDALAQAIEAAQSHGVR
jgi:serine/threonine-protein kinase